MAAEDRCDLTGMVRDGCAHCTGRDGGATADKRRRTTLLTRPGVIASAFPGRCAGCGTGFGPATPIRRDDDDTGWFADCCLDDTGAVVVGG